MKKKSNTVEDDLRPEYDFGKMMVVARGPGRGRPASYSAKIEEDVAYHFPTPESVNEALRFMIRAVTNTRLSEEFPSGADDRPTRRRSL